MIYIEGIKGGISDNLKNILKITNSNISIALNNLKLLEEIEQTQESVFTYLAEISETKSEETGSHIKRVAEYVKVISITYGLSPQEARIVSSASMMHDVGKIAVPEEIIRKKGDLKVDEYNTLKQHVIYGHNMLSKSEGEFMKAAAIISLHHHEKWNGEGYLGLKGEEIHIYARITSIADVFDALTSKRAYKDAWSESEAIGYILKESGQHFDPDVVEAFMTCSNKLIEIKNKYVD